MLESETLACECCDFVKALKSGLFPTGSVRVLKTITVFIVYCICPCSENLQLCYFYVSQMNFAEDCISTNTINISASTRKKNEEKRKKKKWITNLRFVCSSLQAL